MRAVILRAYGLAPTSRSPVLVLVLVLVLMLMLMLVAAGAPAGADVSPPS
ncbi:hypothetical protein GCM10010489_34750 [Microbacterium saperdae]|nr:hypothetical protein GCM10010489_34750 [Microbacterium saperdae]